MLIIILFFRPGHFKKFKLDVEDANYKSHWNILVFCDQ